MSTDWNDLPEHVRDTLKELGDYTPTVNVLNRELKGVAYDPEDGGCVKSYLTSNDLRKLSETFLIVAAWLDERALSASGNNN